MKILSFILLYVCLANESHAQNRSYKAEGYILNETDSVNGWILVPINNDVLDYYSLSMRVTFVNSAGEQKKYKPNDIKGFGFRDDEYLGHYISSTEAKGKPNDMFLKKLVIGNISLLEKKMDRNVTSYSSSGSSISNVDIHKSLYYVQKENEALIRVDFNKKTAIIQKKDLIKILDFLPDSFATSEEGVNFSDLVNIILIHNTKTGK